eukprot:CAMPEP_0113643590 /NCGR_PEP_ID=MMETSP0017_2-20120614/22927_1 /TAXON_ID=2856 /ORGANISM="Cylindrotheca closterium" /LENGTH=569 /DNA_ID=CAMNT_0000555127 /DNA_START=90 /DNA_END=1799 /DNA_ORIENTATION=- /assembly_acc=CAM_ASM_000147
MNSQNQRRIRLEEEFETNAANPPKKWIRGVNLGGWLLAEQFITPYLFAVNSCHVQGDLCWYPGQIGAPEDNDNWCDPEKCRPVQKFVQEDGNADYHPKGAEPYLGYPMDEMTLGQTFDRKDIAHEYMERHWDTFLNKQHLIDLKEAGVTHLRVPMGFWVRGNVQDGEPFIGGSWPYFARMVDWCREIGLEVWADLHGAPGSQNGFDNSGYLLEPHTCMGWSDRAENVARTVEILRDIVVNGIVGEGMTDVVTGVGLLNEPMLDCDQDVLRQYYNDGLEIVRSAMGKDTSVFVGDMFQSWRFNDGFWDDEPNTFLDTHQYHVFFEMGRAFTPRQHIAYLCRHNSEEVVACCYEDAPNNTIPTVNGIQKIVGEWTGAYDQLPTAVAPYVMEVIGETGVAPRLNRTLSRARMRFLENFVKAQMVVYEAKEDTVSHGWFFWNFHMEGGAYAEWDFLRGVKEGWMPKLPPPTVASEDLFGSCLDIYNRTNNDYSTTIDEYPDPSDLDWTKNQGWDATDDFVLDDPSAPERLYGPIEPNHRNVSPWLFIVAVVATGLWFSYRRRSMRRQDYESLK